MERTKKFCWSISKNLTFRAKWILLCFEVWNILSVQIIFKDFRRKRYPPSCKICKIRLVTISPSQLRGRRLIILITGRVINLLNGIYHRMLITRCNNCSTGVHIWLVRNLYNLRTTVAHHETTQVQFISSLFSNFF